MAIWLYIGSKAYPPGPDYTRKLYVELNCTASCFVETNSTDSSTFEPTTLFPTSSDPTTAMYTTVESEDPSIANFYQISYLYISFVGFVGVLVPGLIISLLTCKLILRLFKNYSLLYYGIKVDGEPARMSTRS